MGCVICGRGMCTKSFHSIEEQDAYDNIADGVVERTVSQCADVLERMDGEWVEVDGEETFMIDLHKALDLLKDIY